jgi:hypothetical protein
MTTELPPQATVDYPGDIGLHFNGTFKWSKDMTREELLRLISVMRAESERQRTAFLDVRDLLDRANDRLIGATK